ncbi:Integrase core domain [Phytophthora infestans]|uniref:Integrase core domain n=1 Tax=Phytophthora infestans TaxID=4787 RepID=A0A8S9U093_PHYIN|nr:Integrase core domain [Phytophthora infestans]
MAGVVGQAGASPGLLGVQQPAVPVVQRSKPFGSSKPPKFSDTFEVYQMSLKLYLEQRDSWSVVTGEEMRHAFDPVLQRQFDDRNRLAMETIIRGVKGADAQKVCICSTAKEMWDTLTAEKTQRDFSYAVHLKRELYTHSYAPGQKMAEYIQEMNMLRQRLQHMGPSFVIDDTSMSQLMLMGVCAVHREIVTQFDFSYRQGNPPSLQQVKNALLSRDEMEKMAADTAVNCGASNGGPQVAMHMGKPNGQHYGPNEGPGPSPGPRGQMQTTGAGKRRAIRCYHCKKVGHMRKDCWHYKNKQSKAQAGKGKATETKKPSNSGGGNSSGLASKPVGSMGFMRFTADAGRKDDSSSSSSSSEGELPFVGMAIKEGRHELSGDWLLDSGTSSHVCNQKEQFTSMKKSKASFKVWDGGITRSKKCGKVLLNALNVLSGGETTLELDKVVFSPTKPVNLLSLGLMVNKGWELSTSAPGVLPKKQFLTRNGVCVEFIYHGTHYWLNNGSFGDNSAVIMATVNADDSPLMKWHERLAHLNEAALKFMVKNDVVRGLDIPAEQLKTKLKCLSCMSTKRKRMSYGDVTEKRTVQNFERLTSDVCDMGKYGPGIGAMRYFQLIHDEGSRYKWCYPLVHKSEASGNTQRLMTELLAQGKRIITFTSDGGGEYVNSVLTGFLECKGITFVPTHPYTPEENCLVEKLNGVLVNKMRAVMHAANLPIILWPEVLRYVVEVDNLSPTKALQGLTPTEKLSGLKPDVAQLKVCGCVGYVFVPKETRKNKLSAKAEPGLFLGFARMGHGYRLLHLRSGKVIEARDVKLREDVTVERTYINALLKGRQHYFPQIPFVPLPVEYVADEAVRAGAHEAVREAVNETARIDDQPVEQANTEQYDLAAEAAGSVGAASASNDRESQENDDVDDKMPTAFNFDLGRNAIRTS